MTPSQSNPTNTSSLALVSLALSMLLSSVGISIPNVGLPTLAQVFAVSIPEVQWVILSYLLAVTTLIVPAGRLGDTIGRKRVLLAGISLFTASALLCGAAPALWFLILARAIQGVGAATLMALTVATVSEVVPKERLGRAMGLLGTMSAVGTAAGPTVGGLLIALWGWRFTFLAMVPLGLLSMLLIHRYLPAPHERQRLDLRTFDLPGVLLLGAGLASYALMVTVGGGHLNKINAALLTLAVASGALFLRNESKVQSPLLPKGTLRDADVLLNLTMNGFVSSVVMSTLVVGPFYLSRGLGLSMATVGMVMSVGPITSALAGFPAGRIVDRLGSPVVAILGLIELGLGAVTMSWLPLHWGVAGYVASAVIMSPGYQLFQAANNVSVMSKVPADQRGAISGMLSLSRNLGLITGTAVMGAIFSFSSHRAAISNGAPEAIAHGMRITFSSAAFLSLLALIIAIVMLNRGSGLKLAVRQNSP